MLEEDLEVAGAGDPGVDVMHDAGNSSRVAVVLDWITVPVLGDRIVNVGRVGRRELFARG